VPAPEDAERTEQAQTETVLAAEAQVDAATVLVALAERLSAVEQPALLQSEPAAARAESDCPSTERAAGARALQVPEREDAATMAPLAVQVGLG
jgi:hypothetical protein